MESQVKVSTVNEKAEKEKVPLLIQIGLFLVCIATAVACFQIYRGDTADDLNKVARKAIWTTFSVGNPDSVHFANVRKARVNQEILCGRINYEQADNKGWSGYTDFYIEKGVMYIAPPGGRFAKTFTDYCLTLPTADAAPSP